MSAESVSPPANSFSQLLLERRVPQIFGIYLGASWALVQFVDWLVKRYYFSPHLTDLLLALLTLVIPSVLILAYFHGKPGADRWTRFEKLGIPLNLLVAVGVLFVFFGNKDLGAAAEKVRVQDEEGKEIVRTVAKKNYLKKMAIFYFDPVGEVPDLDWQAYAVPLMLATDLNQNGFLQVKSPFDINGVSTEFTMQSDIQDAGFGKGIGLPLALQSKIAQEQHVPLFVRGTLEKTEGVYRAKYQIHQTKNNKVKASGEISGGDFLPLMDEVALDIKKALGIPKIRMEEEKDRPLVDMVSQSPEAFKSYMSAFRKLMDSDLSGAIEAFDSAIATDPSFAQAYIFLQFTYMINNQAEKRAALFKPLMKHLYKLPERDQYFVKAGYYISKDDTEKAFAVMKMITQLFPQDVAGWSLLAFFQSMSNQLDEAIETNKHILELDPYSYDILLSIGNLYLRQGKYDESESYYRQYADQLPNEIKAYQALGQLYIRQGEYESASANFEKALLIEPENVTVLLKTGEVAAKAGKFERTWEILDAALKVAEKPSDRFQVYQRIEQFHQLLGQVHQAFQTMKLKELELAKFQRPYMVHLGRLQSIDLYVEAGKKTEALALLEDLRKTLSPPLDRYVAIGEVGYYLGSENQEPLQKAVDELGELIELHKNELLRPLLLAGQAWIYVVQGEYENALAQYLEQQKLSPDNPGLLRRTGACLRKMDRLEEAEAALKKSLSLSPFKPKTHYEMALLKQKMGKSQAADEHLKKALDIWKNADPEYKPAAKARAKQEAWRKFS